MPSKVLKDNNINPAHFKAVSFVISMYGTYEEGNSIFPSWLTVAKDAGVNRKTAMKVRDFLIKNGLLIEVSKRMKNISEYKFGEISNELSVLVYELSDSDKHLSNNNNQLSNFDSQLSINSGHNTIIDTTKDTIKDINKDIDNQEKDLWGGYTLTEKNNPPWINKKESSWEDSIELISTPDWDDINDDDQLSKFDYPDEEFFEPKIGVNKIEKIETIDQLLTDPFICERI
jgi:hypothetical protein